jgi:succinoglycan biosynthesis transport protein ExoP
LSSDEHFDKPSEGSFRSALMVLRRRWQIVIGIVAACVLVAVLHSAHSAKVYKATSSVAFQSGTLSAAALQIQQGSSSEPQREANTEVLIAHSSEVAQGVREQLHLSVPAGELLDQVQTEVAPTANVLNITASTGDPRYSAQLANAFAEQYIAFRTKSELAGISAAQTKLQQQFEALPAGSAERATLAQSQQRLGELRAIAGGGANVIGRATAPASPSGTSLTTYAIIGLLVGVATAFLVVFLMEALDRRVRSIEEFEREYRLPTLAAVPSSAFRSRLAAGRGDELEPYRMLRSALEFTAVARTIDSLLITSAVPGEGKTTVAIDFAQAVALTGRRTVLIELDLRRPTFASQFNIDVRDGVSAALVGRELAELMVEPLPGLSTLRVLPSGRLPHNPAELLDSKRMAELIAELSDTADMVIIDAPPLNPVADAQILLNNEAIHGAIVVARIDYTMRDDVRRARAILDRHAVKPVGLVITGMSGAGAYARYGYAANGEQVTEAELSRPIEHAAHEHSSH